MESNVKSLFGGPTGEREVNPSAVEAIEEWLEMAKSGEIVGVVLVGLCHDGYGTYRLSGTVGGYSMLGAIEVASDDVRSIVKDA